MCQEPCIPPALLRGMGHAATELAREVHDVSALAIALAFDLDLEPEEYLLSALARSNQADLDEGSTPASVAGENVGATVLAVITGGAAPMADGMSEAVGQYLAGEISFEEMEERLMEIAGGGAAVALVAGVIGAGPAAESAAANVSRAVATGALSNARVSALLAKAGGDPAAMLRVLLCLEREAAANGGKGLTTPGKFFGDKTAEEASAALRKKFGPPRSTRPGAETFYDPKTGRSYNVHTDPTHGPPHVDIRTRGPIPDRKVPLRQRT